MTFLIIFLVLIFIVGLIIFLASSGKPHDNDQNWHNLYMNRLDR